ncbi:myelin-associated glycoprotein-like [Polypterus senegalus]|uniref:myelin-associated glycoprotein-like n=1 Tax=Polypterus senegalus TaxID=55291 RepID=UPI001962A981|nr:myelin-associated glycoprotein-like [Polypterus senegalus]
MCKMISKTIIGILTFFLFLVEFSRSDDCILPLQMTTLSGSCLLIPCTFGPRTPSSGAVGVWNIGFTSQTPVSRGNTSQNGWSNVKVSLLGDVTQRNCTTLLENLSTSNTETYYFRVESDSLKFSYAEGVHINVLDSPDAPLLSSTSPVKENLNISLNCSSPLSCPTQPPILTWSDTLNGMVLQNITSNNGSQSLSSLLTFRASYELDMKNISCTVWYPVGTENRSASASVLLQVWYAPKNTGIIANTSTDILEGSTVNLQCTSNANPVSNYTWFKMNGSSELLTSFGQNLTIQNVSRSDNGVHLCRVQNGFGDGNSSVTLNVQYPPKETTAHIYPAADIMEGTQVILSCISVINPPGNYTWFKGNGSDATRRAAGQNLSISAVTLGDSGVYYCLADNQYGGKNSTAVTLRIQPSLLNTVLLYAVIGSVASFFVILLVICLTCRRCRNSKKASQENPPSHTNKQIPINYVNNDIYVNHLTVTQDEKEGAESPVVYADVNFMKAQLQQQNNKTVTKWQLNEETEYVEIKRAVSS